MTGVHWVADGGYFVGPICLTNTHSVGTVHQAAVRWMIETYQDVWAKHHLWAMPVVAETYDGILNDINGLHVREDHALSALRSATSGSVLEGSVGGGTGMICYEFKGGTGTSSRQIELSHTTYHIAALVQANHGLREWLTVLGIPVGRHLTEDRLLDGREQGSIIVILATDLPMAPHQLRRLAKRASIGIGRGGTPGGNNSGDIFLAFSTAGSEMDLPQFSPTLLQMDFVNDEQFDAIYLAAVESVEEAVLNAMLAADDTPTFRPADKVCRALPHAALMDLIKRYRVNQIPT
jgi:D-aminopeptidase